MRATTIPSSSGDKMAAMLPVAGTLAALIILLVRSRRKEGQRDDRDNRKRPSPPRIANNPLAPRREPVIRDIELGLSEIRIKQTQ